MDEKSMILEQERQQKAKKRKKYKKWGLLLFVGIPLPGTDAWTGALLAVLLKLNLNDSVCSIIFGLLMAAGIMSFLTYGLPWVISLFI